MSRVFRVPRSQLVDITGELVHDFHHQLFWDRSPTSFRVRGVQAQAVIKIEDGPDDPRPKLALFIKLPNGVEAACTLEPSQFVLLTELWPKPFAWFRTKLRPEQHRWRPVIREEAHRHWCEVPDRVSARTRQASAEQQVEAQRRAHLSRQTRKRKRASRGA